MPRSLNHSVGLLQLKGTPFSGKWASSLAMRKYFGFQKIASARSTKPQFQTDRPIFGMNWYPELGQGQAASFWKIWMMSGTNYLTAFHKRVGDSSQWYMVHNGAWYTMVHGSHWCMVHQRKAKTVLIYSHNCTSHSLCGKGHNTVYVQWMPLSNKALKVLLASVHLLNNREIRIGRVPSDHRHW